MTTILARITLDFAIQAMLNIVERFGPDHAATAPNGSEATCVYAVNNNGVLTPVCIVGQMFADMGILRLLLENPLDPDAAQWCNLGGAGEGWAETLAARGVEVTPEARMFLSDAQSRQDGGATWA